MGIKKFTTLFNYEDEIKYKNIANKNVAIDAMAEIYRCALGMKSISSLTDPQGFPTAYINSLLLGVIFKLKFFNINQYWFFDHPNNEGILHNPLKQLEIGKRKQKRDKAKKELEKLEQMKIKKTEEMFSDTDEEDEKLQFELEECINKKEKEAFCLQNFYISDVKFMLDCLSIPWVEVPKGYESEQIASFLTFKKTKQVPIMDYVLTPDPDALIFGARKIIKRDFRKGKRGKLFEYRLDKILRDFNITEDELIKVALILGTDFAKKTPRVGPKTLFKKLPKTKLKNKKFLETLTEQQLHNIENLTNFDIITLTEEQQTAMDKMFKKPFPSNPLKWNNLNKTPFSNKSSIKLLLDWLEITKGFKRERIQKQLDKLNL